jgi:hypothetical protein
MPLANWQGYGWQEKARRSPIRSFSNKVNKQSHHDDTSEDSTERAAATTSNNESLNVEQPAEPAESMSAADRVAATLELFGDTHSDLDTSPVHLGRLWQNCISPINRSLIDIAPQPVTTTIVSSTNNNSNESKASNGSVAATTTTAPLTMPPSVVRVVGTHGHYYLLGTIHNTRESVEHIKQAIAAIQPDVMVLELEQLPDGLDHLDIQTLTLPRWNAGE